jgi:hypothetical protein
MASVWKQPMNQQAIRGQAGLSLLEVLFAAFLVGTVAVFLAPLFVRAVASNIEGNEAWLSINFDKAFIEQTNAVPMNHQNLDVRTIAPGAPDDTVRRVLTMIYDRGPHDRNGGLERELGDERWRPRVAADDANNTVQLLWDFDLDLRDYSYFDIVDALVSSTSFGDPADPGNPLTLIAFAGDPDVFDNPLSQATQSPHRHLKESTARISARRDSSALGSTDSTDVARIRAY